MRISIQVGFFFPCFHSFFMYAEREKGGERKGDFLLSFLLFRASGVLLCLESVCVLSVRFAGEGGGGGGYVSLLCIYLQ